MKLLFKKPRAIVGEIAKLERDEGNRREDRASVANFFNGAPPLTDEEAAELGFTVNVNHLFGYQDIDDAAGQMLAIYTKPTNLFQVELAAAPPGKRADWGMKAQSGATRVLRKCDGFKSDFQGAMGDATLHGETVFHFTSKSFPLPKQAPLSAVLVPDSAKTDINELSHFGRIGWLTIRELHRIIKQEPPGWKMETVRKLLAKFYEAETRDGYDIDHTNVEELEYRRQENASTTHARRLAIPVTYFYQQNHDAEGEPWALTIMLRNVSYLRQEDHTEGAEELVIYDHEECYPHVKSIIQPMFMDCIIGGESKWHRVLGLGTLNYSVNQSVELMICRAKQATIEGSMNLWKVRDTSTREAVQQILMRHNGVLPEGMDLVQQRYEPNFSGILEMIQFFRQQGKQNAGGQQANSGDRNDQLEVQALAAQNSTASRSNNRSANCYDYLDRMWSEVWSRLTNPFIDTREDGYSEVMDFQNEMARHGIPLYYLQPHNVQVKAVRIIGDGLRQKELAAAAYLSQNRQQFAPQVQPKITRLVTALTLDNYAIAEELTPIQEEPDAPQLMRAESENAIMITTRRPQTPKADDIDELHVPAHFPAMETMLQDALQFQKAAFTPQQAQAFQILGAHVVMHIQRIEGHAQNQRNDPHREMGRQLMDQLNQLASVGEKLLKNMQQQQQATQQEPPDPIEMAKLQLQVEQLKLNTQKLQHSMQKFDRTQSAREQQQAFTQMMTMEKNHRDEVTARTDRALRDVETSLKVKQANSTSQGE
jgi:hypothetical protein